MRSPHFVGIIRYIHSLISMLQPQGLPWVVPWADTIKITLLSYPNASTNWLCVDVFAPSINLPSSLFLSVSPPTSVRDGYSIWKHQDPIQHVRQSVCVLFKALQCQGTRDIIGPIQLLPYHRQWVKVRFYRPKVRWRFWASETCLVTVTLRYCQFFVRGALSLSSSVKLDRRKGNNKKTSLPEWYRVMSRTSMMKFVVAK